MKFLRDQRRELKEILKEFRALQVIKKYVDLNEGFCSLNFREESRCVVWQFWETNQGVSDQSISIKILNKCLRSMEIFKYPGYKRNLLNLKTAAEVVDIPEFVYWKLKGRFPGFSLVAYSDILRLRLLAQYGGIWADATMLALSSLPEEYLSISKQNGAGFTFVRSNEEKEEVRKYWRHVNPGYFSWSKFSKVRWLNSFIIAGENRDLMKEMLRVLYLIWRYEDKYPHYFTVQILYDYLLKTGYQSFNGYSDVPPHYLQHALREPYCQSFLDELVHFHPLQKLTWKYEGPVIPDSNLE